MNLSGMAANQRYVIEFFSTTTNALVSTVNATSNIAGLLIVPVPTVAWDLSFRVEAALPNGVKTVFEDPSVFSLFVYPNPTNENAAVRFELKKSENMTTVLTDLSGRTLQTTQKFYSEGVHNFVLPTHTLPSGVYFLTMRSADGRGVMRKIVKQ